MDVGDLLQASPASTSSVLDYRPVPSLVASGN